MQTPLISVISPYSGQEGLQVFIESLKNQDLPPWMFELIIVEDNCKVAQDVLNKIAVSFEYTITSFTRPKNFYGHAAGICRNIGADIARGEYLLFIDSDCLVQSGCISAYLKLLDKDSKSILFGITHELPAIHKRLVKEVDDLVFEKLERLCILDHRIKDKNDVDIATRWDFWYTSSALVQKSQFTMVGGFDISGYRCHDLDLSYRFFKQGYRFNYAEDAKVIHLEHARSIDAYYAQILGLEHLGSRYPELELFVSEIIKDKEETIIEVKTLCEKRFTDLVEQMPGHRDRLVWVTPSGYDLGKIINRLAGIPHEIKPTGFDVMVILGFHRNCWDYKILIPFL